MDIKKVIEENTNWEVSPNEKKLDKSVLDSAKSTPVTFSAVKSKYVIAASDAVIPEPAPEANANAIDREWTSAFIRPKDRAADSPGDQKVKFFNENGEEMASQG